MITTFKIFESKRQYREVDMQQLWDDITNKYYSKLFDKPIHTQMFFHNKVLNPLLLNKTVEFKRAEHPYDGDVIYGLSGEVKNISFEDNSSNYLIRPIIVVLEDNKKYILGNINNNRFQKAEPLLVKIYDSEELEIEKKINLLKDTDKYNL